MQRLMSYTPLVHKRVMNELSFHCMIICNDTVYIIQKPLAAVSKCSNTILPQLLQFSVKRNNFIDLNSLILGINNLQGIAFI